MAAQRSLLPQGLSRKQVQILEQCCLKAERVSPGDLLKSAGNHLEAARATHTTNPQVNVRLAEAILRAFERAVAEWPKLPPHAQPWLQASMHYFALRDDDEPDLTSPIGFEDDAEILNACLRLAGKDEWTINPVDFDDA